MLETLAKWTKHRHPIEGSLPSSRKRYFDYQKTEGAGLSLPGKLPAPYNSRVISLEFWERESAPAD